jgi:nitrite reductase/ring-hydroxylating ferredoxin subunit
VSEIAVGTLDEFADGEHRVLALGAAEVGVFRRGAELFAYENRCPHYGGPVCQGKIFRRVEEPLAPDGTTGQLRFGGAEHIVCPWHGFEFDLRTGAHPGDSRYRLRRVAVRIEGDAVLLQMPG